MAKAPAKPAQKSVAAETKLVRDLAKILNETDLTEIEMEKGSLKIRVARTVQAAPMQTMTAPAVQMAQPVQAATAPAPASAPAPSAPAADDTSGAQKSPMVGTAYVRPSPDADAFVSEGDSVKKGDTILLIEAMKTFNPITADKDGTIKRILVTDAQPVEFGEALFIIG